MEIDNVCLQHRPKNYPTRVYYFDCLVSTLERRRLWTAFQNSAQLVLGADLNTWVELRG